MSTPAHAPIPVGTGTLTGIGGALVGIVIGVIGFAVDQRLDPEDITAIAGGLGVAISVVAGRSLQAKAAIDAAIKGYQGVDEAEAIDDDEGKTDFDGPVVVEPIVP